jgi:hypothetical protein
MQQRQTREQQEPMNDRRNEMEPGRNIFETQKIYHTTKVTRLIGKSIETIATSKSYTKQEML